MIYWPAIKKPVRPSGFTIVEVLVVLAIGSLILLTVFLAVPQLQRSSRNGARASDAAKILSAINECVSNNNGILVGSSGTCMPTSAGGDLSISQPTTCASGSSNGTIGCNVGSTLDMTKLQQLTTVNLYHATAPFGVPGDTSTAYVYSAAICSSGAASGGNTNQYAVVYNREINGSTSAPVCVASP